MLEIVPHKVHQRTPFFIGSKREVEYFESWLSSAAAKDQALQAS